MVGEYPGWRGGVDGGATQNGNSGSVVAVTPGWAAIGRGAADAVGDTSSLSSEGSPKSKSPEASAATCNITPDSRVDAYATP